MQPNSNPDPQQTPTPQEPVPEPGTGQVIGPGGSDPVANMPIVTPETYTFTPHAVVPEKKRSLGKFTRRSAVIIAAASLFVLGSAAAAYFGYYLPNKPENVWAKALVNTGKGFDKLSEYTQSQFGGGSQGMKIKGNYKVSGSFAADGTFEGTSDGDNSEFTASLSASGVKVKLDTRTIKSATDSPDIYFKLEGLQGLGTLFGGAGAPYEKALNSINGKWYFIDHTLFDQYAKGANSSLQINEGDVKSILKAIGNPSKQYLFTDDESKMVLKIKQYVVKEKQDSRNVYHYKVGINKNNLKAYNNAVCDSLKDTKIFNLIMGNSNKAASLKECRDTKDIDNIKDSSTADVWVDLRTKLIHKVRFTETSNNSNYFDIGQDYQGGDIFPFSMYSHSNKNGTQSNINLNMTLNMKTNTLTVKGSAQDSGNSNTGATVDVIISRNNTPVKVEKPTNSKTLIELLNDAGFGDFFGTRQP